MKFDWNNRSKYWKTLTQANIDSGFWTFEENRFQEFREVEWSEKKAEPKLLN